MSIFDEFRGAVDELLSELGAPVTLERVERVYSELSRSTNEVRTTAAGRGALIPPSGTNSIILAERVVDATLETRQFAIVGSFPAGVEPAVDDVLSIGGRRLRINGVTPIRPDGQAMAWRLALEDS